MVICKIDGPVVPENGLAEDNGFVLFAFQLAQVGDENGVIHLVLGQGAGNVVVPDKFRN